MKNRMKMLVLTSAIVGCLTVPSLGSATTGGWSEDTGYSDPTIPTESSNLISPAAVTGPGDGCSAASKPQSHTGKKIAVSGSDSMWKIKATTKWMCKYHFSRARWENLAGTIKGDSGRKYGTGSSSATSGALSQDLTTYVAKTYWGT
ncbi:hypothetical protein [Pradoshia sp.]